LRYNFRSEMAKRVRSAAIVSGPIVVGGLGQDTETAWGGEIARQYVVLVPDETPQTEAETLSVQLSSCAYNCARER
jgi:hypothetical protein